MSSPSAKTTARTIAASFLAGAGAMVMIGLVAPVAVQGGLAVRDAMAATMEVEAPAIEPLDLAAIESQLATAERDLEASRATTADEFAMLDRLAGR
ncbi:MAG: hypothetical protein JNM59_06340 [Hyphomonadaceae bacterium]|nr:hypothetical protein [Hyphomonadaceae bacterium]